MKLHLVCYEDLDGWVLGKITRRLGEELRSLGMEVSVGKHADPTAEVNHHICYWNYVERASTLETLMITHIDDEGELAKVKRQLIDLRVDMGICMSFEAVHRLAHFELPRERLCFVSPAHDGRVKPRPTVIGLTARLYDDRRKREHMLLDLAALVSPQEFSFKIMGSGWGSVVEEMRTLGFEIEYHEDFDLDRYCALITSLDYFLYLGRDEGSLGFLDALAAGVPTIVTAQGFHLDAPEGIAHSFDTLEDLQRIFEEIVEPKRRRSAAVATWTWQEYARNHLFVWEYLLRKERNQHLPETLLGELDSLAVELPQ